jgi:oligoribonuclease NrnB/cAMP/cGMP phosphodiesterase (DHH superfamily)
MKIYHHNDMDGWASLYTVLKYMIDGKVFKDNGEYAYSRFFYEVNYESNACNKFALAHDETVYIVDYSFTEDTINILKGLLQRGCEVVWIDHHDSTMKLLANHPELRGIKGIRSKSMSGAALCYLYATRKAYNDKAYNSDIDIKELEEHCPKYIQYISDYDTWTHSDPNSLLFKYAYDSISKDFRLSVFDRLENTRYYGNEYINKMIVDGRAIKNYTESMNESFCRNYSYESEMYDGTKCLVLNVRGSSLSFGNKINDYPICATAIFNGEEWLYSLYSTNKDIDCSKYAEHYDGGGHKGAAGFRNKDLIFKKK